MLANTATAASFGGRFDDSPPRQQAVVCACVCWNRISPILVTHTPVGDGGCGGGGGGGGGGGEFYCVMGRVFCVRVRVSV